MQGGAIVFLRIPPESVLASLGIEARLILIDTQRSQNLLGNGYFQQPFRDNQQEGRHHATMESKSPS